MQMHCRPVIILFLLIKISIYAIPESLCCNRTFLLDLVLS